MKIRSLSLLVVLITLPLMVPAQARAATLTGFAAMGASETAGTGYTGSWVPYLAVDRGLNFGPGQSYNEAVGGATTTSLLSGGQHTAVESLVQANSVDLSYLFIGGNDVGPVALQLATGSLNATTWANGMVSRILTATDTVLSANPEGMVIAGLPDMTLVPAAQTYLGFATPAQVQNVVDAIDLVNTMLQTEVLARNLAFLDIAQAMRDMNAQPLIVGGVVINTTTGNSNPTHFFQDGLHPAAIGNGIFANLMLTALNDAYGQSIAPISDELMLQKAGLSGSYTGETSSLDYSSYIHFEAVPEPSSFALLAFAMFIMAIAIRRGSRKRQP